MQQVELIAELWNKHRSLECIIMGKIASCNNKTIRDMHRY